jgi:hypothetical protein
LQSEDLPPSFLQQGKRKLPQRQPRRKGQPLEDSLRIVFRFLMEDWKLTMNLAILKFYLRFQAKELFELCVMILIMKALLPLYILNFIYIKTTGIVFRFWI